jgi:hypothetical protein
MDPRGKKEECSPPVTRGGEVHQGQREYFSTFRADNTAIFKDSSSSSINDSRVPTMLCDNVRPGAEGRDLFSMEAHLLSEVEAKHCDFFERFFGGVGGLC